MDCVDVERDVAAFAGPGRDHDDGADAAPVEGGRLDAFGAVEVRRVGRVDGRDPVSPGPEAVDGRFARAEGVQEPPQRREPPERDFDGVEPAGALRPARGKTGSI